MSGNEDHAVTDGADGKQTGDDGAAAGNSAGENDEAEGDNAEDERMLFGEKREETTLFAGSELGVTRIDVAAAQVGQFSLIERRPVRCLATDGKVLVVATDEEVLVTTGETFREMGFGPATAVGIDDDWLYAATDGSVARLDREAVDPGTGEVTADWEGVGEVSAPNRFDGDLLATDDGVVRVGDAVEAVGLNGVRDVSGPLAATAEGLYRHDGEWKQVLAGDATAVIEAKSRAFAVVGGKLYEESGEWTERGIPGDSPAVDLAFGRELAVITEAGTVHVAADPERTHDGHGGWRSQALGLRDVAGFVAVVE